MVDSMNFVRVIVVSTCLALPGWSQAASYVLTASLDGSQVLLVPDQPLPEGPADEADSGKGEGVGFSAWRGPLHVHVDSCGLVR